MTRDDKRQQIIDAAIKLFVEKGVEKTKIVDISREAGIGKSTYYEYFRNKAELVCQWMERVMEELAQAAGPQGDFSDNKSRVKALFLAACAPEFATPEALTMFIEFWRLAINEKLPVARQLMHRVYAGYNKRFASLLRAGIEAGEFGECDPESVAHGMVAGIDGLWLQYLVFGPQFDIKGAGEVFISTMLRGIEP